jgi:hypothetical protein
MGTFQTAYRALKDTAWLDAAVKYYDYCIGKMQTGPDGYKGWVGQFGETSAKLWADVHVGDAIMMDHMLDFAEIVLNDEELAKTYRKAADRYVALARRDLIEKWDSRGTWREDGPYGAYVQWDTFADAGDINSWNKHPELTSLGLSLPFNKQNDVATCCLKLYRITGEPTYREKAQRIFSFMKSRFLLADGHYVWNYWEPFGQNDVNFQTGNARHWMNVHGYRNYQAGEIHQIVEAYHTGVVFDRQDIERIIATNLEVMWNKDKENPKWVNSNATLPRPVLTPEEKKAEEERIRSNPYAREGRAGTLWTGLLDFSPTVRELYALRLGGARGASALVEKAYYDNVMAAQPPGFRRRHADLPVTVFDYPFGQCRSLTVASVLPSVIKAGTPAVIFCKARIPVDLQIDLYSADGRREVASIHRGKVQGGTDGLVGVFFIRWDPGSMANVRLQGDYRIRWTVADGYREFPITIAP